MKKLALILGACFALVATLTTPTGATVDDQTPSPPPGLADRYIVIMEDEPLVTEFGRDAVDSAAARNRGQAMKAEHARVLREAGLDADDATHEYTVSLNGFAAELNSTQLTKVKEADGVLMVLSDVMRFKQTDSSPEFLGLNGGNGAHRQGLDGEGVVVGVIDNGIWPEHPSFADDGSYSEPPVTLEGDSCQFGNTAHRADDLPFECNNKLIGARQMLTTYRSLIGAEDFEFDSARDDDGHGTHTASTAAGNADVDATVLGNDLGSITGIAPRAHVIAYKGLGYLGGFTSDLAAAIDQAVLDGVDVINYSIGGGAGGPGADEISFLFAADAGVRVATSAGNSGSGAATLGNPGTMPWLTTVGANTQSRFIGGTIELGNGDSYTGASITQGAGPAPLVDAEFAGGDLCIPGTLDATAVDGAIVLCRRGAIARADKSLAVQQAGGVGMIMYENTDDNNLFTDSHWVPSVHIDNTPGLAIKAYIASAAEPTASLVDTASIGTWPNAPTMALFSSRGPNPVAGDIIKPDITGPGFQILAGYSPAPADGQQGELFAAIAGTSMSSPHVAGAFALLAEQHPDWSAAATKSAIMTTAHQDVLDNDRVSPAGVFDMGAGHLNLGSPRRKGSAFQPGLVYEAGFNDYLGFLCDAFPEVFSNPGATCAGLAAAGIPTSAFNLNYPSIGVAELAGSQVVTRTVTSVANEQGWRTYEVSVDAPDGYEVEVTPSSLRLKSGQSASYQVRITNVSAPIGEWREGSLTWESQNYSVRSPIAVKGAKFAAPAEVTGSGESGSASFPISFGYTGDYAAAAHGLEAAGVFSDNVAQDPDQTFDPSDLGNGANLHEVTTTGAALLRIAMPPDAVDDPDIDIDLFVYGPAGNQIATSTAGGTDELIDLLLPADGTYQIYVHGWSTPGGADYDLYTWVVSATPGGNLSIDSAPSTAVVGASGDIDISWTGATAGQWHLGAVSHSDAGGLLGLTLVEVDNR